MLTPILSILIWFPIACGALILVGGGLGLSACKIKRLAVLFSVIFVVLGGMLVQQFDLASPGMQLFEMHDWIPMLNIHYALGVDGVSVLFILLTIFTHVVMVLSAWKNVRENAAQYMAIFFFSAGILNGIFASQNAILFYFFWEASMLPLYFGIGIWGGGLRSAAALKFFLYNLFGSLLMLLAFAYLYAHTGNFDFSQWQHLYLTQGVENMLFAAFFLAFAVKLPMWPLHTWFTDLIVEAPLGGTIALAALMLKNGAYGFLRFNLSIIPHISESLLYLVLALALIAIIYIGFVAVIQKDMRRLIAYSSISHMGIVVLGVFMVILILKSPSVGLLTAHADAVLSLQGAIFQMIAHAFASGGLLILVAILAVRFGGGMIQDYQGLAKTMPVLSAFFVLFAMANVGLPGTAGFIGEFFVIVAAMHVSFLMAACAALILVLSPAYMLWLVKRVIFGEVSGLDSCLREKNENGKDLNAIEWLMMLLLAIPVVYFGVNPHFILNLSLVSSNHLVDLILGQSIC